MPSRSCIHVFRGDALDGVPTDAIRVGDGAAGYLAGPALFDPQVNGFAGIDFQRAELTRDAVEHAVEALRKAGCSHFLLTLITAPADFLDDQFARLAEWIESSPRLRAAIPGFHLEGPFISGEKGYVGAHPAECACDPDWALFERWQRAARGRIRVLTLDPAREGAMEFIRRAAAEGVFVCLGHTGASLDELRQAVAAGARLFTHLGNGCPAKMPRHDNIIQRVLAEPGLMVSMIPDGAHLPPFIVESWTRILGPSRVIFTTDAMAAAGAPPGRYTLGRVEVELNEGKPPHPPGMSNLAGSGLTPARGLLNVMRFGGLGAGPAWRAWTSLRDRLFPEIEAPLLLLPFPDGEG